MLKPMTQFSMKEFPGSTSKKSLVQVSATCFLPHIQCMFHSS